MPRQPTRNTHQAGRDRVESVLSELLERRIERDQDIGQYSTLRPHEFHELWLSARDFVMVNYGVGGEKQFDVRSKAALFMTLVTLKEGGTR
ncbi:hypothetical protein GN958_ATG15068 [Phytophthora infestans]|uniref:Uncharacterized protein n=1 Tax=Phytophthora infestans TaxID=4787 RepID=A0A8S9U9Z8_PHYIN|nr:hypothetical protein GN958_ATG15068 [Phytophthora infestans]